MTSAAAYVELYRVDDLGHWLSGNVASHVAEWLWPHGAGSLGPFCGLVFCPRGLVAQWLSRSLPPPGLWPSGAVTLAPRLESVPPPVALWLSGSGSVVLFAWVRGSV